MGTICSRSAGVHSFSCSSLCTWLVPVKRSPYGEGSVTVVLVDRWLVISILIKVWTLLLWNKADSKFKLLINLVTTRAYFLNINVRTCTRKLILPSPTQYLFCTHRVSLANPRWISPKCFRLSLANEKYPTALPWRHSDNQLCPIIVECFIVSLSQGSARTIYWTAQFATTIMPAACSDPWIIGVYVIIPQAYQYDSGSDNCDQSFGNNNDGIASRVVVAPLHQAEMSEGPARSYTVPVSYCAAISIEHYKLYIQA